MAIMKEMLLLTLAAVLFGMCAALEKHDFPSGHIDDFLKRASKSHEPYNFNWDAENHISLSEYDILMPQEEWLRLHSPDRQKRAAGIYENEWQKRWSYSILFYELNITLNEREMGEFKEAINDLEHFTCLKFVDTATIPKFVVDNFIPDIVQVISDPGCYSYVGRIGGKQPLSLGETCRYKMVILHEIAHALGVMHEQTRPDRDDYVNIILDKVPDVIKHNFDKYTWDYIINMGIDYDFYSIMHYGKTAFSSDGSVTIETKDPKYQDIIGNNWEMTFRDIKTFNEMYKCPIRGVWPIKDKLCPGEGFVGKDGRCWCPGTDFPVQYCSKIHRTIFGDIGRPKIENCDNNPADDEVCQQLAKKGYCTNEYAVSVRRDCKRSCGMCE